ncbi:uncharacterized protein LOC102082992 isoform X2 [Oreochromis niloticus]|uniref:uncharacterized protein LOC102082992 isoform X2 n=1 Tax=Oreochromis niloticus TaxID=8128 RepID=UPI000DF20AAE|nr:uncharacterized protein LOC102082992 isoform X2 [Oreochromis niloticus]
MTLPHVTAQHSHRCSIIIHMKKRGMGLTEVHKKMMMEKQEDKAESAGSSCPSVRSDRSKPQPPGFSAEPGPTRVDQQNSEVPSAAGGQHHHFCEERAKEDPEVSQSRLPRMLRESEGG